MKKVPVDFVVVNKDEYWKLKTENADISLRLNKLSQAIQSQRTKNSNKILEPNL